MLQGIWLGRNRADNRREIEAALKLARRHPGMVKALIVGNETLLRGELAPATVKTYLEEVKRRSGLPVTYADVWEFWLKSPELASAADFVTIHILPYWEDDPVSAKDAVAHVREVRAKLQATFAGKEILIGEVGWPSEGRMREGALPSPANQARVLSGVVAAAKQEGWKVNLIEAFDQPWKRLLEGTVGGYWGLYGDQRREPKFQLRQSSVEPARTGGSRRGSASAPLFSSLSPSGLDRDAPARERSWQRDAAASVIALGVGLVFGLAATNLPMEGEGRATGCARSPCSFWLSWFPRPAPMRLRAATVSPALPRRSIRRAGAATTSSRSWLAALLAATMVAAMHVALGLVFDPRYKDFPFAALTGPVVALAILGLREARAPLTARAAGGRGGARADRPRRCSSSSMRGSPTGRRSFFAALLVLLALTALAGEGRARLSTSSATASAEARVL